jgi:methylmalonyl-CoA mutase cobalamin-binding subunit
MLPGDDHEGGLLMAALLLAVHGHRVIYLGRETPIEEISAAVRDGDVESVAVSVSAAMPRARASSALSRLRKSLPVRVTLWLGGSGAPASVRGTERFASLGEFTARLAPRG